ncbi:MAG: APC family permease [Acidobacteriota bacterium]
MHGEPTATMSDGPKTATSPSYGLREGALSPMETLAQSVSTIAPSTSPTFTVPLVFALAGAGTALAYGAALGLMVLVALCVASFARESSSPGSIYVYTQKSLPPVCAALTAWALFFAYVMTAASVIGGFESFAISLMGRWAGYIAAMKLALLLELIAAGGAMYVAYRDVKVSAQLMLWIEAISVFLIAVVVAATLWRHGWHFDHRQVAVHTMSPSGMRLGVMLAIFSFVGFESATTLGAEARDPLRTIPRAVILSAVLVGVFFIVCAYGEVMGFRGAATPLDANSSPIPYLAAQAGIGFIGPVINAGVLVSMFACTLSCVIAASRVMMLMAHHGLAHKRLTKTHAKNDTPGGASVLAAVLAFVLAAAATLRGASGADIYGWMGTMAVFGFLTAYAMGAVALLAHLKKEKRLGFGSVVLTTSAALAMVAVMVGNVWPVPPAPYKYFPTVYAAYLVLALGWMGVVRMRDAKSVQ